MDTPVTLLTSQDAAGLETSGPALVVSGAETGGHGHGPETAVRGSIATMEVRGAVEVVVVDDTVFLTGAVESSDDINRLVRATRMVDGVDRVVSRLVAVLDAADPAPRPWTDFEAAIVSGPNGLRRSSIGRERIAARPHRRGTHPYLRRAHGLCRPRRDTVVAS